MVSILDDLADFFPDVLVATPGVTDVFGDFVASGEVLSLKCHIEGENTLIRDAAGREVVSSVQVIVAGTNGLTTHLHRYTLPARFVPNTDLRAIAIDQASDEDGAHHETVHFP